MRLEHEGRRRVTVVLEAGQARALLRRAAARSIETGRPISFSSELRKLVAEVLGAESHPEVTAHKAA
jgi:hypothetical protein